MKLYKDPCYTIASATFVIAASDSLHKERADYVCNGIDDQVEIQAAIDALYSPPVGQGGGGSIYLTEGTFNISSTITINKYTNLIGAGNAITILRLTDGADCDMFHLEGPMVLPKFANFRVDGNKDNQTQAKCIFKQTGSAVDILFEDIWFSYCKGYAIYLNMGWDHRINRCQFETSDDYGIYLYQSDTTYLFPQMSITNSYFVNPDGGGIFSDYDGGQLYGIIIQGNNFQARSAKHYVELRGARSAIIAGNSFFECRDPIYLDGAHYFMNNVISGNTFHMFSGDAITISPSHANIAVDNIINDNTFWPYGAGDPGNKAIVLGKTARTKIHDNTFAQGGGTMVCAIDISDSGCIDASVMDNTFAGTYSSSSILLGTNFANIKNNQNYIHPGEIRTASGNLNSGNVNDIAFSWHNPEEEDILITKVIIEVITVGGTVGSHLDVGIADDVAGTNRGTEFFNDIDLNAQKISDSYVAGDGGTQTKYVFCDDTDSATNGYIVGEILDANASNLEGKYYIEYRGR